MSSGYKFTTREELDTAVDLWISNQNSAIITYGEINTWDVSGIADFSRLFGGTWDNPSNFNSDISNWDVSSGTNFRAMFYGADAFNQDIGSWDVSSGTDFTRMFNNASAFNKDIGSWDVSNVTRVRGWFNNCRTFNEDLSNWNTTSLGSISDEGNGLFSSCYIFNNGGSPGISGWDVSNWTNSQGVNNMFQSCGAFNQPLDEIGRAHV